MSSPADDPTPRSSDGRGDPATNDGKRDLALESCRGFLAELLAHGVRCVIASPGSRNTPLLVAASRTPGLDLQIHLDERDAAFMALGRARASGRPVALVCTSGSAVANYLPAVVEAGHSGVPLIVVTSDRPPELRGWGAGQTIDQIGIFGSNVRWSTELAVPGPAVDPGWYRRVAARAFVAATDPDPGPVHLNWPFREPLGPEAEADAPTPPTEPLVRVTPPGPYSRPFEVVRLAELAADHESGLIVAGPFDTDPVTAEGIRELSRATGWPLLAEPTSKMRFEDPDGTRDPCPVIGAYDQILRSVEWSDTHQPDVVLRFGSSPTSKTLRLWLERHPPDHHVLMDPHRRWNEASFTLTEVLAGPAGELCGAAARRLHSLDLAHGRTGWTRSWLEAETASQEAIDRVLTSEPLMEAGVARVLSDTIPPDTALMVANSMPVRDIDAFWRPTAACRAVYSNRGANGIDGLTATAIGLARSDPERPVVLHIGDLALLHDVGALLHAAARGQDLTVVVPDNGGGGIFSFLPVAGLITPEEFDRLFHTPPVVEVPSLGNLDGVEIIEADSAAKLAQSLTGSIGSHGVSLIRIPVDSEANVDQHRRITEAVTAAVIGESGTPGGSGSSGRSR